MRVGNERQTNLRFASRKMMKQKFKDSEIKKEKCCKYMTYVAVRTDQRTK